MNEEISICNPKLTEFDIWNAQPRKVVCTTTDKSPMSAGDEPTGLVAGNEYEVERVQVESWYTLVKLAGVDGWYNSVLFSELDGYEPVKDSPSKRAWLGTPQPGDWD